MKYCSKCGAQLNDLDDFCYKCGQSVNDESNYQTLEENNSNPIIDKDKTLIKLAFVFMIIGTIANCLTSLFEFSNTGELVFNYMFWIPLCWCIPVIIVYKKKIDNNQKIPTSFKICTLLFVNLIAGIVMLCNKDSLHKKY